jgi:hypothetical protein
VHTTKLTAGAGALVAGGVIALAACGGGTSAAHHPTSPPIAAEPTNPPPGNGASPVKVTLTDCATNTTYNVLNTSKTVVKGVQVNITFVGPGGVIQGTNTADTLAVLQPGQSQAVSAQDVNINAAGQGAGTFNPVKCEATYSIQTGPNGSGYNEGPFKAPG